MRAIAVIAAIAVPRIALADWQRLEDTDCRCELALPDKPTASTRPSPWPNIAWHRLEVRVSPTEWYAVSYAAFDKAPPGKPFDVALAGWKGTVVSRTPSAGRLDARVKLGDASVIAVRFAVQGRRVYMVEAGDVAKGTKPDQLFAGFHAWTDKDATPEGTVGAVTGDVPDGGGLGTIGGGGGKPVHAAPIAVSIGSISTEASLDNDVVRRSLTPSIGKLAACYDQLARTRHLEVGSVHAKLTVGATGAVSHPSANGIDESLDSCLARVIGRVVFAKPTDGKPVDVMVVLQFDIPPAH